MAGPSRPEFANEAEADDAMIEDRPNTFSSGVSRENKLAQQKAAWDRREIRRAEAVKNADIKRRGEQIDSLTGMITRENTIFTATDEVANPFPFVTGMNTGR